MTKTADIDREITKDVFQILQRLYGVRRSCYHNSNWPTISVNGVALSPFELSSAYFALFGAFLITVVPFYHGGSMYLLKTYIHGSSSSKKGVALVVFWLFLLKA